MSSKEDKKSGEPKQAEPSNPTSDEHEKKASADKKRLPYERPMLRRYDRIDQLKPYGPSDR